MESVRNCRKLNSHYDVFDIFFNDKLFVYKQKHHDKQKLYLNLKILATVLYYTVNDVCHVC